MRFGVREIAEVVFRAKAKMTLGGKTFYKNDPVIYFDTLKTSSVEGSSTTVYAQGGRGNVRLVSWEGERVITFNMEDALISPESLSILTGAGLAKATAESSVYVHTVSNVEVKTKNTIEIPEVVCWVTDGEGNAKATGTLTTGDVKDYAHDGADIFCMVLDANGLVAAEPCVPSAVKYGKVKDADGVEVDGTIITCKADGATGSTDLAIGTVVKVDYYVKKASGAMTMEITPEIKGHNYYIEASTLFRDEATGEDMPAEFIIPNGRVQSNFTFSMAATGDPSTFSFVVDAFPGYTKFNPTEKVLAVIQVVTEASESAESVREACDVAGE